MSDLAGKAALDALAFVEQGTGDTLDRHLNMDAVEAMEAFIRDTADPCLCPFCGVSWDGAEAKRLMEAQDATGYVRWIHETLALPVNAEGDDWGERSRADGAEG